MASRGLGARSLSQGQDPFRLTPSTMQYFPIGQKFETDDGKVYRYVKAGGSIGIAELTVQPTALAIGLGEFGETTTTAPVSGNGGAVGDTVVRVNKCAAGAWTAHDYQDGTLVIQSSTGAGYSYKIKDNDANATTGTNACDIDLYAPGLVLALSLTTVAAIYKNRYRGVTQHAVAVTGIAVPAGIATRALSSGQFGWVQTWGVGTALIDATSGVALGVGLVIGDVTAGSVQAEVAADIGPRLGFALTAVSGAATTYALVELRISN